jgi:hypothetical protein
VSYLTAGLRRIGVGGGLLDIGEAAAETVSKRTLEDDNAAILSEEGPIEESDGAEIIVSLSTEEETTGGVEDSFWSEGERGERRWTRLSMR